MTKNKKILLAAGGTGGHLFPAMAIADDFNNADCDVHLVTDLRCQKYLNKELPYQVHIVDLYIQTQSIIKKVKSVFRMLKAIISAFILIRKLKPDVIVGFGGYPSFPSLFICKLLSIPIILHEQNCFLAKTNALFVKSAKLIALSYPETKNISKEYANKTIVTGNFIRRKIKNLTKKSDFNSKIFNLFIFGGSQSARIFSTLIPESIEYLLKQYPKTKLKITQQAATADQVKLKQQYENLNVECELSEFFFDMHRIYMQSDLVISRAGASTIAELSNVGLPTIFIPLPSATQDHQYHNAKALADDNSGWCYRQNEITKELLALKIHELIMDRNKLKSVSKKLLSRKTGNSRDFADTVLKIIS